MLTRGKKARLLLAAVQEKQQLPEVHEPKLQGNQIPREQQEQQQQQLQEDEAFARLLQREFDLAAATNARAHFPGWEAAESATAAEIRMQQDFEYLQSLHEDMRKEREEEEKTTQNMSADAQEINSIQHKVDDDADSYEEHQIASLDDIRRMRVQYFEARAACMPRI